ncbi:hypothetical protein DENIT_10961 [Pseudomonas veronii]|nr:hypothetical protein DENIT_10961 [Pseudomonas veronii]
MLAKNFNEYAGIQGARGAFEFFASKLAPTTFRSVVVKVHPTVRVSKVAMRKSSTPW